jgi:MoxR-like ATPase
LCILFIIGDHLLLIGNQGVGKNKLADYFLQLLQLPREYIQLHRDSTVQSLTTTPAIREGVLLFEDSPLVKAVRDGKKKKGDIVRQIGSSYGPFSLL